MHLGTGSCGCNGSVGVGKEMADALTRMATRLARRSSTLAAPWGKLQSRAFSDKVNLTFISSDGSTKQVEASMGEKLLDVAQSNDVELEGACGGELACSTCHLIFEKDVYDKLPKPSEEEEDMLDLAWGLTDTSRLGCQIKVTKDLEGAKIKVPDPY